MKDRYEKLFASLKAKQEIAFIPFLVIGDPTKDLFLDLVDTLVSNGADALELGIAFTDPVADGPTVQEASQRVLANNYTIDDAFVLIKEIRERHEDLPIGLLVYANIVHSINDFGQRCQDTGIDSILVADLPVEEQALAELTESMQHKVYVVPPNADENTIKMIADQCSGYVYVTSRAGVTGADNEVSDEISQHLALLEKYDSAPPVLGFGISKPEHVIAAKEAGFSGVIVGSALVNMIASNQDNREEMISAISQFTVSMKECTKG